MPSMFEVSVKLGLLSILSLPLPSPPQANKIIVQNSNNNVTTVTNNLFFIVAPPLIFDEQIEISAKYNKCTSDDFATNPQFPQ